MDWITDDVAIGNYLEAQDSELLRRHGFRSVLSLDGTLTPADAPRLRVDAVATFRLIDGPGNDLRMFRQAVESLGKLAESHAPVLVHCHAGRSRSVVVVAGHLARSLGIDPEEAIARVTAKREVNVTPALAELLFKLE